MNEKRTEALPLDKRSRAEFVPRPPKIFSTSKDQQQTVANKPALDRGRSILAFLSLLSVLLCALPLIAVALAALGDTKTISRLGTTLLPAYALTTLQIMVLVGLGTALIGAGAAWLVTAYEFAGRRVLEIALVIPLAFPAYVLAYAYTDLLDHPGAVQTLLRSIFDWGPRDYWFPEIRSPGGAALMLTLVLYPYVYLITRAALLMQGLTPFMVARSLGSSSPRAFFQIALPMVQPAILGGVLLALMETIADFGTVAHFGVQTLATGIYTTWFTLGDRTASAQMALGLLAIALLLLVLERYRKAGEQQLAQDANRKRHSRLHLTGGKAALAAAACGLPVLLGAVIPIIMLVLLAFDSEQNWLSARYLSFATNSLILASTAAGFTVLIAVTLSYHRRLSRSPFSRLAMAVGRMGYAVPGGVIAVGLFIPFAAFDNAVDAWARETLGISTGLIFSGSIALLVMAYAIRFLAAALGAWRAGEAIVTRDLDHAAQGMGASTLTILRRIHIPILTPAALTALLLVFVDTIKELPATLIMRPFGWDTLAVQAYRLAADERLEGAAVPSLVIVMIGLLPVILLCSRMGDKTK
ncbi:MAG: iron ABC transporter permease [Pseudomonadota bacterium]